MYRNKICKPIQILVCLVFSWGVGLAYAQNTRLDSLEKHLSSFENNTTERIQTLNRLSEEMRFRSTQLSLMYAQQGLMVAQQVNYQQGISTSLANIGIAYYDANNFDKALYYFGQALKNYQIIQDKKGLANTYRHIGNIYFNLGEYEKSLQFYIESFDIYVEINDKMGIAAAKANMGSVYFQLNFYDKALADFEEAFATYENLQDQRGMAITLHNIGNVYEQLGQYNKALIYYQKGLKADEKVGFSTDIAESLIAIGGLYNKIGDSEKALTYYDKAYKMQRKSQNQKGMSLALAGTGEVYLQRGKLDLALEYYQKSIEIAQTLRLKELLKEGYEKLAEISEKQADFQKAYRYHKLFKLYEDSLYNQTRLEQITEMQAKFELKGKEEEILSLSKLNAEGEQLVNEQQESLVWQRAVLLFVLSGVVVLIIFAVMLYRGRVRQNKINIALKSRNEKIENQANEIQLQARSLQRAYLQIKDSIRYAQTLQYAILPTKQTLDTLFKEHFLIYQPKDIVSGDFYWASKISDKTFVAVIDCTGHGVAGAMVSMIGSTLLSQIVNQKHIFSPAEILAEMHHELRQITEANTLGIDFGMEVCLCMIEPSENEPYMQLTFAGAKRSLFLVQYGEMTELKGDRQSVGLSMADKTFENRCLEIPPDTILYLTTDGFVDQSNEKHRRIGSNRFREILRYQIGDKPLEEQKDYLEKVLESHQKNAPQRDDITVLGIML